MHIPIGAPVSLTLQTPTCSPTPCYLNGVIHSFWIPALNGKKDVVPGRKQFLKLEADKPGRLPRPVRGVLRPVARQHAHARDRGDPADYEAWVKSQLRARPASKAALEAGRRTTRRMGARAATASRSGVAGRGRRRTSPTSPTARRSPATCTSLNYDNLWQWVYDAPSRKPMGNLSQHMPNFSAAGMTPGGSTEDRLLPADEHRHEPEPDPPECVGK